MATSKKSTAINGNNDRNRSYFTWSFYIMIGLSISAISISCKGDTEKELPKNTEIQANDLDSSDYNQSEIDKIYGTYYKTILPMIEVNGTDILGENANDIVLGRGVRAYDNQRYIESYELLRSSAKLEYQVYAALSLMELDNTYEAKILLQDMLISAQDSKYKGIIYYYLGLTYLKEGDIDKAKGLFQNIVATDGYKAQEAKEILGMM